MNEWNELSSEKVFGTDGGRTLAICADVQMLRFGRSSFQCVVISGSALTFACAFSIRVGSCEEKLLRFLAPSNKKTLHDSNNEYNYWSNRHQIAFCHHVSACLSGLSNSENTKEYLVPYFLAIKKLCVTGSFCCWTPLRFLELELFFFYFCTFFVFTTNPDLLLALNPLKIHQFLVSVFAEWDKYQLYYKF